ncbi:MAG: hypothetical protein M3O91_01490 [Chloroflexota bacterium]|nr:hypothetical protein [Chloroflexota bacterium]
MTSAARYRQPSGIGALEVAARLQRLPEMCALLVNGHHNDENDPGLLFDGLPFASVVRAASVDPIVAECLRMFGGGRRWVR